MNDKTQKLNTADHEKVGFFAKIALFVREVIAELKKVIWPTKEQLTTYFSVVIVFVLAMVVFTGIIDVVVSWLVKLVYGG